MRSEKLPNFINTVRTLERPILVAGGIASLALTLSAFSPSSREVIKNRAGGKSELSGLGTEDGHIMHAAHLNHDKTNPNYDDPRNGVYLTVTEHYQQHLDARGKAREIGLNEHANEWAINKLSITPARRK